jgi:PKHD-type hydroxylase
MTNYIFQPSASFGVGDHPFATWENAFTGEEVDKIVAYCEALPKNKASVGMGEVNSEYRRSEVAWVEHVPDATWIFDRMAWIARQINGQFYRFDLYGFCEHMQFTTYDEADKGCYDWHVDAGTNTDVPRKMSLVLQLSEPEDYEGGNLEILKSKNTEIVLKKKGLVAAFPSYTLHRVSPVTKGHRKSLVVWVSGPQFR